MNSTLAIHIIVIVLLFWLLFLLGSFPGLDFWWSMAGLNIVLIAAAFIIDHSLVSRIIEDTYTKWLQKLLYGILSAVVLYLVFFAGNKIAPMFIPTAAARISGIYALKNNVPVERITLLIAFIIGPGEELLWRGYLQHHLQTKCGKGYGMTAVCLLYATVHIPSGNLMLVLAALVCGLFWGLLYLQHRSVMLNIISHTLWDLAAFVVFPFR